MSDIVLFVCLFFFFFLLFLRVMGWLRVVIVALPTLVIRVVFIIYPKCVCLFLIEII